MTRFFCCLVALVLVITSYAQRQATSFEIKDGKFLHNGKAVQIHSGEIHYARIPKEYWQHRLRMVKAMGLNTIATYVFWNYHNTAPGVWDFQSENRNLTEFIKLAQQEGLFVILRPGPYACAEWEFGGYPWWLVKNKDLVIRANNKAFLDSCHQYINKLAGQVKSLQITQGGPIIMVQVENEFGSYVSQRKDIALAEHRQYNRTIYQYLQQAGFNVPFFTSDGTWLFEGGSLPGVLPTANGEGSIENLKKAVNQYHQNQGPYMVAEFYPGWLDHWGEPFVRIGTESITQQTEKCLQNQVHFNLYMVHGGTNFGFTSGANYNDEHDIQPDITSYDYDAPISEAGWATPKYTALRDMMTKYVSYPVPEIPARMPVLKAQDITLSKAVSFFEWKNSIKPVISNAPLSFEDLNQGSGYVLYSKKFNQPIQGTLRVEGLRDYALVYVNGRKVGELNRQANVYTLDIDIPFNGRLDLLVENMGRVNYGARITESAKGIVAPVRINDYEITGDWKMYSLPFQHAPITDNVPAKPTAGLPAIYRGTLETNQPGDVFLDMQGWGKGIVFVNGHHAGRYWKVGPQQTLYIPGCWLQKGKNEFVVFEQQHDAEHAVLKTVEAPILESIAAE